MTIQMVQKEVDGIEFYISDDAKLTGLGINGLARLCGVNLYAMQKLLLQVNEPTNRELPKNLQPFTGKVFELLESTTNKDNAKVISSELCAAVVEYYAFDSKAANDTAKFSFRKFASKGINSWIKEITGYNESQIPESKEIISILREVLLEVSELKQISKEYKNLRGKTVRIFPALDKTLEELAVEEECLPEAKPQNYTLTEWVNLSKSGITLDKSTRHRFALLVSETYKSVTGNEPKKEHRQDKITKKRNNSVSVYSYTEFPILQLSWNKLFNS